MPKELVSGDAQFAVADLRTLSSLVADAWLGARNADWMVRAGSLDWTCLATADHAVDCVYAPAFFLAARRLDDYPSVGLDLRLAAEATPDRLVESLRVATAILAAVVNDAPPDARAVIFRRPEPLLGAPTDFAPRAALELILHAHDVAVGLGMSFRPPSALCARLREHTRPWPMWAIIWDGLETSDDPWGDLLAASGRRHR